MGLVFAEQSRRRIDTSRAATLAGVMRNAGIVPVGLFVDPSADAVRATLDRVPLGALQFQGSEPADFCGQFGVPYIKAVRVRSRADIAAADAGYPDACALHLDAYVDGQAGGTGETFDWDLWPADTERRLILAGGLTPANVRPAIDRLSPWAVDVSTGVETAVGGQKDVTRMTEFVQAVRRASAS